MNTYRWQQKVYTKENRDDGYFRYRKAKGYGLWSRVGVGKGMIGLK